MRLKKNDWIFIVVVGAVVGALVILSTIRKPVPAVSASAPEHAGVTAETTRDACLACHAPDSGGKLVIDTKIHPTKWSDAKMSCTQCHKVEPARTASIPARPPEE